MSADYRVERGTNGCFGSSHALLLSFRLGATISLKCSMDMGRCLYPELLSEERLYDARDQPRSHHRPLERAGSMRESGEKTS